MSKTGRTLTLSEGNARASVLVQTETWCDDDGYEGGDETPPFTSAARLTELYAQHDDALPRAPRGLARELLCQALRTLTAGSSDGALRASDVLVLEADESEGDELVRKVYAPMGFKVVAVEAWGTTLMRGTVGGVLRWCEGGAAAATRKRRRRSASPRRQRSPRRRATA